MPKNHIIIPSPLGKLLITEENGNIIGLEYFCTEVHKDLQIQENRLLKEATKQVDEYFQGTRKTFDLPLSVQGTDFQNKAWTALQAIPYGETRSYQAQAEMLGNKKAVRAVGGANNKNPIAIIIPCHRVLGKNGKLVGYASGIDKKAWLLDLEAKHKNNEISH